MTEPTAGTPAGVEEPPEGLADPTHAKELMEDLAALRAAHPNRRLDVITFADRDMIVFCPTEGQIAAMAQLGRSAQMADLDRVANLVDVIQSLLVESEDQLWLGVQLLSGAMDFGVSEAFAEGEPQQTALGLLDAITRKFRIVGNRAERRARRFR